MLAFPLVYIGWAYLFWLPVLLSDSPVWSFPNLFWFLGGGASPLLAGLGLAALSGGAHVSDLWERLVDWRRIPVKWWLILLGFWLVFDLLVAGAAICIGITDRPLDPHWGLFVNPAPLLFLLLLSFVFPAAEEIGLRGFYLDKLQRHMSPVSAALINGIVWALWHAPFVWFTDYYAKTSFDPSLSWWLPMIVCHTLMLMHVYNATGRSILAVTIFHAMMNFTGEWLRVSPAMYPFMLVGNVLAALVVVWWWRDRESVG